LDSVLYDAAAGEWVGMALAADGELCIGHTTDPTALPWD